MCQGSPQVFACITLFLESLGVHPDCIYKTWPGSAPPAPGQDTIQHLSPEDPRLCEVVTSFTPPLPGAGF
jgi:hypothetical protein